MHLYIICIPLMRSKSKIMNSQELHIPEHILNLSASSTKHDEDILKELKDIVLYIKNKKSAIAKRQAEIENTKNSLREVEKLKDIMLNQISGSLRAPYLQPELFIAGDFWTVTQGSGHQYYCGRLRFTLDKWLYKLLGLSKPVSNFNFLVCRAEDSRPGALDWEERVKESARKRISNLAIKANERFQLIQEAQNLKLVPDVDFNEKTSNKALKGLIAKKEVSQTDSH